MGFYRGPNIVTAGLVFAYDAGSERSYPRNNLDVSWVDYNSGLANGRYSIIHSTQPYDILINTTYTSWVGSFSHDVLSAEDYTIMFDYVADASSSLVLDNDGVNDNNWNATIPVTTSVQTYNVTKAVTVTGNIKFYPRRASGGNITISNFRFFKASSVNSLSESNTGTLTNGVGFSNDNGGTFTFDGTDDYINIGNPTALQSLTTGTIEAVYYRDASTGTYQMIFTDSGSALEITYLGNTLQFYIGNSGISVAHAVVGEFFHVVGVWGSGYKKLYLNGSEVASGTNTGTNTGSRTRYIGGRGANFPFNGKIPLVRVYTAALTATEVTQNYNAQKSRFGL
jgi:hypothetical protein